MCALRYRYRYRDRCSYTDVDIACVCMYVCMCLCTSVYVCVCARVPISQILTYVCTHQNTRLSVPKEIFTNIHTHTDIHMCVYITI